MYEHYCIVIYLVKVLMYVHYIFNRINTEKCIYQSTPSAFKLTWNSSETKFYGVRKSFYFSIEYQKIDIFTSNINGLFIFIHCPVFSLLFIRNFICLMYVYTYAYSLVWPYIELLKQKCRNVRVFMSRGLSFTETLSWVCLQIIDMMGTWGLHYCYFVTWMHSWKFMHWICAWVIIHYFSVCLLVVIGFWQWLL